ncbi:N-acetylglucosamine-specific PTS transporter subunit IIBC [Telmatospirillum sp.]|uniref:N-acetylglucosamine-specific PTS transporter subunit IIBC n=1 Tax=Telmatospirillum sp. TaxID=2079197 RepID=UPI002841EEA5|nr:N-acetylglucosamine-specific PTS transporter subunit IIBC [Telmatospirillum sp.]MDR3438265.1 N-acetylglucosamine-specific PTS transporter subunit IIBC [Telmatospirillum sp.]
MSAMKFGGVQKLGRALMLPIAVLPIAGLLLRLGQPDLLAMPFVAAAGDAIFANLGILFAIGVAVGFAEENHGAAGLAGVVGYFVTIVGAQSIVAVPPDIAADVVKAAAYKAGMAKHISIPVGILCGLTGGWVYNHFHNIRLPDYLAFFGGRRFVPIATGFAALFLAAAFGWGLPSIESGLDALARAVFAMGDFGLFLYGVFNRLLIVTGLHHILNSLAWFILGNFNGTTGDLNRFFAGDPTAGAFMAGFFPVMMFGLPAACLAMYHAAPKAKRARVGGILLSMALTAFLTGVTEPVEFSFMFLAPSLYAVHAVLTGLSLVIMDLLNVKLGFGFSAGLFDYVINFKKATNPWLLMPVGAVYFALYYGLFRVVIAKAGLRTIGREDDGEVETATVPLAAGERGLSYLQALGGAANVKVCESCATRLRIEVADNDRIDDRALKALGARGVVRLGVGTIQVVIGPIAEQIADEVQAAIRLARAPRPQG